MKNLLLIISLIGLVACNSHKPHPEYAEISGKIINANSKEFAINAMGGFQKKIALNEDGSFKDTLKVVNGNHRLMLMKDKVMTSIYLENGKDFIVNADVNDFINTLQFELDFVDYNSYLNEKEKIFKSNLGFQDEWYRDDIAVFNSKMDKLERVLENSLNSYSNITKDQVKLEKASFEGYLKRVAAKYENEHKKAVRLAKGKPSPTFENYENFDGSKTSLSDFKGKYVYVDVWATWCAPCKYQIPYLAEIEKEYHGKNIVFVSLSVDKEADHDKWKKMVEDKNMSGVQLFAPNKFQSEFVEQYDIHAIPRFILIDTEGNIVDFSAPRPSEKEKIRALFSTLNI